MMARGAGAGATGGGRSRGQQPGRLSAGFGIGALEEMGPEDEDVYDTQHGGWMGGWIGGWVNG